MVDGVVGVYVVDGVVGVNVVDGVVYSVVKKKDKSRAVWVL